MTHLTLFSSYYNFRLGQQQVGILEEDTRLSVLQSEWFQGKRGLDVGCNSGDVTIAIGKLIILSLYSILMKHDTHSQAFLTSIHHGNRY